MNVGNLHAALTRCNIAQYGCALWQIGGRQAGQGRGVTKRIRAIFQCYKAKSLCRIKPFYGRALRPGPEARTRLIEMCHHVTMRLTPCP